MKQVYTRRELIHTAIKRIREYLYFASDKDELTVDFINKCYGVADVLQRLGVISVEDEFLLRKIINREFYRIIGL